MIITLGKNSGGLLARVLPSARSSVDLLPDGDHLSEALQSPVEQRDEDKDLGDRDGDAG